MWVSNKDKILFNIIFPFQAQSYTYIIFPPSQNTEGEFPVVLGRDCSGVVVAVGTDVTRVEQGEEV